MLEKYYRLTLDEERALYASDGALIEECSFSGPADGESALKESRNITVKNCTFELRYPLWHVRGSEVIGCTMTADCRAPLWYCADTAIRECRINGVKTLRECDRLAISDCEIISEEFGWINRDLTVARCRLVSDYPLFGTKKLRVDALQMEAKYSFQYVEDAVLRDCELKTKDAFWHSKNVTVYDSVIAGEYLGWYSENLRLVRCRISGTQPLCYCRGLVLEECTMEGTDLSFEKSQVSADVRGTIESVKNPESGQIRADAIGRIILDGPSECSIETAKSRPA